MFICLAITRINAQGHSCLSYDIKKGIGLHQSYYYKLIGSDLSHQQFFNDRDFDVPSFRQYYKSFLQTRNNSIYPYDQIRLGLNFISFRIKRESWFMNTLEVFINRQTINNYDIRISIQSIP